MSQYSRTHLSDAVLLRDLAAHAAQERTATATLLADLAEVDARKLYLPAAYPSMFAYCVGELQMSEDGAYRRITAARAARRFPAIFEAVAKSRLHLTAVSLLAPHLTEDTAAELFAAATYKSKSEIERLLAERFPRPDMLAWVAAIPAPSGPQSAEQQTRGPVEDRLAPERVDDQLVPERVDDPLSPRIVVDETSQAPGPVEHQHAPGHVDVPRVPERAEGRSRVKPLSPQSFEVQFTASRSGHDKLRYAQELLGHRVPPGDIAQVYELALDALIPQLEQRKFAATERPRTGRRRSTQSSRHVPAHVRRAVWERDGGQCTFTSDAGRRCSARRGLQFDHIQEVARGGEATASGIRLRCRAHNQYTAGCAFGAEFMRHKRVAAAEARAKAKAKARATAAKQAQVRGGLSSFPASAAIPLASSPSPPRACALPAPC